MQSYKTVLVYIINKKGDLLFMRHKIIPLLLTCAFLSSALVGCSKDMKEEKAPADETAASETGEADTGLQPFFAPLSFETVSLEGENTTSDIVSASRLTMINVWATYCNPCLNEMPGLGELALEYEPEDFQLIGIVSDVLEGTGEQGLDQVRELVDATGADTYMHLLLSESLYDGLLSNVSAVPTTFFIDAEGRILDTVVGAMEKEDWKEKIDGFLEER